MNPYGPYKALFPEEPDEETAILKKICTIFLLTVLPYPATSDPSTPAEPSRRDYLLAKIEQLLSGGGGGAFPFWKTGGNTNGSEQILGTLDAYDLPIYTNNVEVARFYQSKDFSIVGTFKPGGVLGTYGQILSSSGTSGTADSWINLFDSSAIRVDAATTAALPAVTYANGAGGVGATLTANANGAFPATDGVAAALNNRYLVKNQPSKLQNGVYLLTTLGTVSTPFVLTRAVDSDQSAEFDAQIVIPARGTLNKGHIFRQNTPTPNVGTSIIVYVTSGLGGNGGGSLPTGIFGQTLAYDSSNTLVANSYLWNDGTNVGVNTSAGFNALFQVKGTGHSSAASIVHFVNDDASQSWTHRNDGAILRNGTLWSIPYNDTTYNISFGYRAGLALTSGQQNTFFGYDAGKSVTSGNYNLLIGSFAGYLITTGVENTIINNTTVPITTGSYNTLVGSNTLVGATSSENVVIGDYVGNNSLTGALNVFIGQDMLTAGVTTAAHNVVIGYACTLSSASRYFTFVVNSSGKTDNTINFGGVYDYYTGMYLGGGESNTNVMIQDFRLATTSANAGLLDQLTRDFYISSGKSTGAALPGNIIFQVTPPGASGTAQNAYTTIMTILGDGTGVVIDAIGALTLPRITSAQRDALVAVKGMTIYNTTTDKFQGYDGAWTNLE